MAARIQKTISNSLSGGGIAPDDFKSLWHILVQKHHAVVKVGLGADFIGAGLREYAAVDNTALCAEVIRLRTFFFAYFID